MTEREFAPAMTIKHTELIGRAIFTHCVEELRGEWGPEVRQDALEWVMGEGLEFWVRLLPEFRGMRVEEVRAGLLRRGEVPADEEDSYRWMEQGG